jgi:hypothetical protein
MKNFEKVKNIVQFYRRFAGKIERFVVIFYDFWHVQGYTLMTFFRSIFCDRSKDKIQRNDDESFFNCEKFKIKSLWIRCYLIQGKISCYFFI